MSRAPHSPVTGLLDAMHAAGIAPADHDAIAPSGVLHRYQVATDKPGSKNGWAVLHHDHGAAGSWKSGATCSWSAKDATRMTQQEKDAHFQMIQQAKAEAQRQRETEQQAAAGRASMLWAKATPAKAEHPYLVKKRIPPGPARQSSNLLVLRIEDVNGNTKSLQYISGDGTKRMLCPASTILSCQRQLS